MSAQFVSRKGRYGSTAPLPSTLHRAVGRANRGRQGQLRRVGRGSMVMYTPSGPAERRSRRLSPGECGLDPAGPPS